MLAWNVGWKFYWCEWSVCKRGPSLFDVWETAPRTATKISHNCSEKIMNEMTKAKTGAWKRAVAFRLRKLKISVFPPVCTFLSLSSRKSIVLNYPVKKDVAKYPEWLVLCFNGVIISIQDFHEKHLAAEKKLKTPIIHSDENHKLGCVQISIMPQEYMQTGSFWSKHGSFCHHADFQVKKNKQAKQHRARFEQLVEQWWQCFAKIAFFGLQQILQL